MKKKYKKSPSGNILAGPGGHPIVVDEDGSEKEINAIESAGIIQQARHEGIKARKELQEAQKGIAVFETLKTEHPSFFEDPVATMAGLEELEDLRSKAGDSGDVEKRIETYKTQLQQQKQDNEVLLSAAKAEVEAAENAVNEARNEVTRVKFFAPLAASSVLKDYALARDPEGLQVSLEHLYKRANPDGSMINEDGTVNGFDGLPLVDLMTGKPYEKQDDAFRALLNGIPNRDNYVLSGLPEGDGSSHDGSGGGGEYDKFFKPGDSYNLTKQYELKVSNPGEHARLVAKYKK